MTAVTAMPAVSAEPEGGLGGGFCRVQIAGPTTRVDLAVPTAVPLAALLPSVVAFAEQDGAAPHGWALSRLDGTRLDPAAALAVAGIREGELLLLHPARDRVGEPLYDDVVEVLGEGAAEPGWSSRDTRAAAAVLGVLAVLGAVWAGVAVGTPLAGVLLGVLTLLLLGGGAALSHAAADVPAGTVLGALAAVTGAAFGVVLLGPPFGAAHVLVAAAVAVLVAATGPALVDGGDAVFVGLGLTALLALLGGGLVLLAGATPAEAAAVVAPLALALTTAAPTVALRLSRIPRPPLPRTAADLAEVPGQLDLDRVLDRVRRARALLSGLVAGCYAAATLGVAVLTSDTTTVWSAVLAAVLTILMLLRARLFRQRAQVAAPLVGVAVILLAAIVAVTRGSADSVLLTVVLPVALVLAVVAGAFGVWGGRRPLNPRLSRALDVLETLLLLAVVPLALAVWDVYTLLLEIRA
jgi:type VII secretion integral membrane protein EccD